MTTAEAKKATLFRMVTPEHICPFGLKARDLLQRKGFDVSIIPSFRLSKQAAEFGCL